MARICYVNKRFASGTLDVIDRANAIIEEYVAQGFDLTLRQIYYQFVARGLLPNNERSYKRLGSIINDARLAGLIDWEHIVDRTRFLRALSHWDSPSSIIESAAHSYLTDRWARQPYRVEVWIEKDALAGVFQGVCEEFDVPYFSCRGYASQTEVWRAGQRLLRYLYKRQDPLILHFGDHDPSGIDMTRDIVDRLRLFTDDPCLEIRRLALNWDQVEEHQPPPNPTKLSDTRATAYIAQYGGSSWELDAMEPAMLAGLVRSTIETVRDDDLWEEDTERQETERKNLKTVAQHWGRVTDMLSDLDTTPEEDQEK